MLLAALSVSRGAAARDFLRELHLKTETYAPDMTFAERVSLDWGALHIEGYATPGHSRGSACYRIGAQAFFSGDTIVPGCAAATPPCSASRPCRFCARCRPSSRSIPATAAAV